MKGPVAERLSRRHLLPSLPGFRAKKAWLLADQPGYLLRGFAFESSGFDPTKFTMWAFIQALYIPSTEITFTVGNRLGRLSGGSERWWWLTDENESQVMGEVLAHIQREGLPFLQKFTSPADLADRAVEVTRAPDNVHIVEAVAYSLVLADRHREALEALARLRKLLGKIAADLSWPPGMTERVQLVDGALQRDPREARALLDEWREETIRNLRLSEERRKQH